MAYSEQRKEEVFEAILKKIEEGEAVRQILKSEDMPSSSTFYEWLEEDDKKAKRYARACDLRAEILFEEILIISDKQGKDVYLDKEGNEQVDHNIVGRNRLQIEARKWMLGKMNPKKYGDKLQQDLDITSKGESIVLNLGNGIKPTE